MADGDERTRTRRPAAASSDPRDETGSTARSGTRPVSTGRARAARARPPDDPLARLQALHPTTGAPAGALVLPPTLPPPAEAPAVEAPAVEAPAVDEPPVPIRDRARARAHRRGATSEVPATSAVPTDTADPDTGDSDTTDSDTTDPDTGDLFGDRGRDDVAAEIPVLRLADDRGDAGAPRSPLAGGSRGLVLPVEPMPSPPRGLLPTGRLPRIGTDRPSPISDLPLTGIEPEDRSPAAGTVLVPELDPSGEIVRDGTGAGAEKRTLRQRLEPVFVRRPRPRVRRVTRVVRHLDTWSVFKVALVFNLVLYVVCLTAGVLLWNVAYTTGTIDNVEKFFEQFGWDHFEFHGGEIYHHAWIAGLFATIGLTGFAVLLATVFNLITDLVGGIRLSVLEEEVIERVPNRGRTRVTRTRRPRRREEAADEATGERPIDRATGDVPVIHPDL